MRHRIFICFLLLSFLPWAQIGSIQIGEEFVSSKSGTFQGFIGESDIALFGVDYQRISRKKQSLKIQKFAQSDLSLVEEVELLQEEENWDQTPLEVYYTNEEFYLFSKLTNSDYQWAKIVMYTYDQNALLTNKKVVDTISRLTLTETDIQQMNDKSGFAIIQTHPHALVNRQVVDIKMVNNQGEKIWSKELISQNSVHKLKVEQIICLQNEVFLLCNYGYNSAVNSRTNNPTIISNKYSLWVYNHDIDFLKEVELRLKLKWINGAKMALNSNNEVIIAGFVNSSREFQVNAFFNVVINKKYEPKSSNYFAFDDAFLSKFLSAKGLEKSPYLENVHLKNVYPQTDGSFFVIGEEYYKYIDQSYDPRTNITTTTDHYNYNSLAVAYFNAAGKLMWNERLPKFQNSINDYGFYSSFTALNSKNYFVLFYNDAEVNLSVDVTDYFNHKTLYNNRRHALVYTSFDKKGVVKRRPLTTDGTNFMMNAKQSNAFTKNKIYLMLDYGRHSKIMKIDALE